ncbi:MAG: hypothetical protein C4297_07180 [Gemmataceae bacterium]
MKGPANQAKNMDRRAFTLVELLLVLAIVALVAGMSAPYFQGWFEDYRLRQSVEELRTLWTRARARAMEEGRAYRFGWDAASGSYRLAPADPEYWTDIGTSAGSPEASAPAHLYQEGQLPEGVRFISAGTLETTAAVVLLFWPDGSARVLDLDGSERPDFQLILGDRSGRLAALYVRALTGVITVQYDIARVLP